MFNVVVNSQYHLAVAGGCAAVPGLIDHYGFAPTRYREVVLTVFH
jgi:hypothetical protein